MRCKDRFIFCKQLKNKCVYAATKPKATVSEIWENLSSILYLYAMHKRQKLYILVNRLITKEM